MEAADKGKAHSHKLITDQIMKGRAKTADRDALLARITPTADYADLAGCDLVVEAVFEDPQGEGRGDREGGGRDPAGVHLRLQHLDAADHGARARLRRGPEHFIGIHFFSPVEKMMLVEVILGKETGDRRSPWRSTSCAPSARRRSSSMTRAASTPIAASGNYIREGHLMLTEGVPPAMIENAAQDGRHAGRPAVAQRRGRASTSR